MADSKLHLVAADPTACGIQFLEADQRMNAAALDDAIRAQLLHVAIGVDGTACKVRMLVDLSVWISLEAHMQGDFKSGVVVVPAQVKRAPHWHELSVWDDAGGVATAEKKVCTSVYSCKATRPDGLQSAIGDAFTLRLMFDGFGERQTIGLADLLIHDFAAWQEVATSLREAMDAIRSTLLEPRRHHFVCVPLLYRSAEVCRGWAKHIAEPVNLLPSAGVEGSWAEPKVPCQLTDLLAARCETLWREAAKALQAPGPAQDGVQEQGDDLLVSSDAADDYVCADRMLTFWYGSNRRRRRRN